MMQIAVSLNVATVDFLRCVDGKEVVLDTAIDKNDFTYLLIYPKEQIHVGAIDDIINSDYDVGGFFNGEVGFDAENPFKYEIGLQLEDSAPFVLSNDVMFQLINKALIHNGIIDNTNQSDIVFDMNCYYGIKNTTAIITTYYDEMECMIGIEDVEIIED